MWTRSYERGLGDMVDLQSDVAAAIAHVVSPAVTSRVRALNAKVPTDADRVTPDAFDAYLKGRYESARWPQIGAEETALRYYSEAISKAPNFAYAYAAIAELVLSGTGTTTQDISVARAAATRALTLDPDLPDAHVAIGLARFREWDWKASEDAFQHALTLNPNSATAHQFYAQLLRVEMRLTEALREARVAEQLEPLSLPVKTAVGWVLFNQHRYSEAIATWNDVLELDPRYGLAAYNAGLGYALMGRGADVLLAAERAKPLVTGTRYDLPTEFLFGVGYALDGHRTRAESVSTVIQTRFASSPRMPGLVAALYLTLGRKEEALAWLERGYQRHDFAIANITSEPWFDPLRDDPRFRALRARLNLP
jgi:serine/threonine-protein kinase